MTRHEDLTPYIERGAAEGTIYRIDFTDRGYIYLRISDEAAARAYAAQHYARRQVRRVLGPCAKPSGRRQPHSK